MGTKNGAIRRGIQAGRGDTVLLLRGIADRVALIARRGLERIRHGRVRADEDPGGPVVVVVDGVGRFLFAPYAIRRALRELESDIRVVHHDWQFGLTGEIWTDLMWLRRNRVMGARLARRLLQLRRQNPDRRIHVFALSGGCAIAVFACESLRGRRVLETLVLAAPALSRDYNLGPALAAAERCYVLVSSADKVVLGAGTSIFGTSDRQFASAAGRVGFVRPPGLPQEQRDGYDRCRQIRWCSSLVRDGHSGGHAGWIASSILRKYLSGLLAGNTELPTERIGERDGAEDVVKESVET